MVPSPITFDDAVDRIISAAKPVGTERISITDAHLRVMASTATARRTAPQFAVSAMDGYAVRVADLSSLPTRLKIVGTIYPETAIAGEISPGECVRIFTGAALPSGADCVIIQEAVAIEAGSALVMSMPSKHHVRMPGSDFRAGQEVVAKGCKLGAQHLIALAAARCTEVDVFRRPRVGILCSGSELIPADTIDEADKGVPESISIALATLVSQTGGIVTCRRLLPDDLALIQAAAGDALHSSDLVVTVGGASVGDRDHAKAAFEHRGMTVSFAGVRMKPGKPTWFGEAGGKLILGLPGNPTSAFVAARLFLVPLISAMAGANPYWQLKWRPIAYENSAQRRVDRDVFVCATQAGDSAYPAGSQDSANQRALADANLLLRLRPEHPADAPLGCSAEAIDF